MPESFGARLRQRREEQNVPLSAIAAQTKIKLSLLDGLERDDVSHWPSGIFRRAYVRSYAHAIGLDPDAVVREFLEIHPDPEEVAAAAALLAAAERAESAPSSRLRSMVGSALSRLRRSPAAELSNSHLPPADDRALLLEIEHELVAAPPRQPQEAQQPIATVGVLPQQGPRTTQIRVPDAPQPAAACAPEPTAPIASHSAVPNAPEPSAADLAALARLCTELGRANSAEALPPLLSEAAGVLGASGLILWMWDAEAGELRPALAHGYTERVLAQLPGVTPEADNATAAAFRLSRPCAIAGGDRHPGALVLPLLTPVGCAGVLALELPDGGEQHETVRAMAAIVAAFLAQLTGGAVSGGVPAKRDADPESAEAETRFA